MSSQQDAPYHTAAAAAAAAACDNFVPSLGRCALHQRVVVLTLSDFSVTDNNAHLLLTLLSLS